VQLRQELGTDAREAMEVIRILRNKELKLVEPLELDEG
jgi:hypothetical protein